MSQIGEVCMNQNYAAAKDALLVRKGGVCFRHGTLIIRCSSYGCTNIAKRGGVVCIMHGGKQ
eukprot:scaffold28015_cov99-Skeletonema_dohrnii-CCMP3373.AAC.1